MLDELLVALGESVFEALLVLGVWLSALLDGLVHAFVRADDLACSAEGSASALLDDDASGLVLAGRTLLGSGLTASLLVDEDSDGLLVLAGGALLDVCLSALLVALACLASVIIAGGLSFDSHTLVFLIFLARLGEESSLSAGDAGLLCASHSLEAIGAVGLAARGRLLVLGKPTSLLRSLKTSLVSPAKAGGGICEALRHVGCPASSELVGGTGTALSEGLGPADSLVALVARDESLMGSLLAVGDTCCAALGDSAGWLAGASSDSSFVAELVGLLAVALVHVCSTALGGRGSDLRSAFVDGSLGASLLLEPALALSDESAEARGLLVLLGALAYHLGLLGARALGHLAVSDVSSSARGNSCGGTAWALDDRLLLTSELLSASLASPEGDFSAESRALRGTDSALFDRLGLAVSRALGSAKACGDGVAGLWVDILGAKVSSAPAARYAPALVLTCEKLPGDAGVLAPGVLASLDSP